MNRMLVIGIFGAATALLCPAQQLNNTSALNLGAAGVNQAQQEIRKLEEERRQAVLLADLKAVDRMTADDYTLIGPSGEVFTKTRLMDMMGSGDLKFTSIDNDDVQVRLAGDAAVVSGHCTAEAQVKGMRIAGPYQFKRVYLKRNGRWEAALQRDGFSRSAEARMTRP